MTVRHSKEPVEFRGFAFVSCLRQFGLQDCPCIKLGFIMYALVDSVIGFMWERYGFVAYKKQAKNWSNPNACCLGWSVLYCEMWTEPEFEGILCHLLVQIAFAFLPLLLLPLLSLSYLCDVIYFLYHGCRAHRYWIFVDLKSN